MGYKIPKQLLHPPGMQCCALPCPGCPQGRGVQVFLAGLCHLGRFYGTAQAALSLPRTSTCREAIYMGGERCQHLLPSLTNPFPPSLLVSSHSATPGTTRAPFLRSEDTPVDASSQAQPEPQALAEERLSPWFVPNPMSSGAEPGNLAPIPGSAAGHGAFSSRLQPQHST